MTSSTPQNPNGPANTDPTDKDQFIPVILVLTVPPKERDLEHEREEEMVALLDTAGCKVMAVARQHLSKPVGATYIGKGKCHEVWDLVEEHEAQEVVFDVELSPSQERNLEKALEITVVDYTALILHIFARNARTHQSMLAVELAQLEHNRSRLKRMWSHLDRIKAGTNMRGPGEKQLESDKRLVDARIRDLKDKLQEIEDRKERAIQARGNCMKISLVGYTNAGKSTLMNALTGAGVLAQDRLFATLDTRTSKLDLDRHHEIVLSDTVGFIRNLPHKLIASFHATLAEVFEADLLLHVVDSSLPSMAEQIEAVEDVLAQIGANEVPTMMVFNKADQCHSPTLTHAFHRRYKQSVMLSAKTGEGVDDLKAAILEFVTARSKRYIVRFSAAQGALHAFLHRSATVIAEDFEGDGYAITIEADDKLLGQLQENEQCSVEAAEKEPAFVDKWAAPEEA